MSGRLSDECDCGHVTDAHAQRMGACGIADCSCRAREAPSGFDVEREAGRVLLLIETIEACTDCEETFTMEELRAFDPDDNDHCPKCDARGTMTTYYGDPECRVRGWELGDPDEVFRPERELIALRAEVERMRAVVEAAWDAAHAMGTRSRSEARARLRRELAALDREEVSR